MTEHKEAQLYENAISPQSPTTRDAGGQSVLNTAFRTWKYVHKAASRLSRAAGRIEVPTHRPDGTKKAVRGLKEWIT